MDDIWKKHISVLLEELVSSINVNFSLNIVVDATLGLAWHSIEILKKLKKWDILIWFDADKENLWLAKQRFINIFWDKICFIDNFEEKIEDKKNIILINSNFWNLQEELQTRNIKKITAIYYDLGLSSLHLDEKERWFSFMQNWPLDMRLDKTKWIKASQIVNSYTQKDLREIFIKYWESAQANKIAHKIIEKRKNKKFETTFDLASIIDWPPREKAKIFQALRIEVNKELEMLEKSLFEAIWLLEKEGNIFVISFHSLEDRIVKHIFKQESRDCICNDIICSCRHKRSLKILTKKPIIPSKEEIKRNPRSRSAKARLAVKII